EIQVENDVGGMERGLECVPGTCECLSDLVDRASAQGPLVAVDELPPIEGQIVLAARLAESSHRYADRLRTTRSLGQAHHRVPHVASRDAPAELLQELSAP